MALSNFPLGNKTKTDSIIMAFFTSRYTFCAFASSGFNRGGGFVDWQVSKRKSSFQKPLNNQVAVCYHIHVTQVGVPVLVDLPGVGENLQDHVGLGGTAYTVGVTGKASVALDIASMESAYGLTYGLGGPSFGWTLGEVMGFISSKCVYSAMCWTTRGNVRAISNFPTYSSE